jgi:1,2-diacylglycerol 3-alpha-glucosyltransferase
MPSALVIVFQCIQKLSNSLVLLIAESKNSDLLNINTPSNGRIKLALVSTGLGNVHRGFEVSTRRWFDALKMHPDLDVRLFCGGPQGNAQLVNNLPRNQVLNMLGPIARMNEQRFWEFSYVIEQISFAFSFWQELQAWQPDVVWTKDVPFAHFLPYMRTLLRCNFKTVFSNGGAFRPDTYKDFDFIQHLTPSSFEEAILAGLPKESMTVLPNCVTYDSPEEDRTKLRRRLGYNDDDFVVITVSAWNCYHKRIDYLIDEIAAISDQRVKLLLCGQPETDIASLKEYANQKLKNRIQWITIKENEVANYLKAADIFALASLHESFGNVIVEAALAETPIICHAHDGGNYILQDKYWLNDLSQTGALGSRVLQLRSDPNCSEKMAACQKMVSERFAPPVLVEKFVETIKSAIVQEKFQPRRITRVEAAVDIENPA